MVEFSCEAIWTWAFVCWKISDYSFNFSLRIMFAVGLSYIAFIMLRFWRVFIINECWILSKAFSASIEIIIWLLFFNLLMWCITLIDLQILKNPCIPGIKVIAEYSVDFPVLYNRFLLFIYLIYVCVCTQSCPTLCNPMDCSTRGSSVHGIFQARILE